MALLHCSDHLVAAIDFADEFAIAVDLADYFEMTHYLMVIELMNHYCSSYALAADCRASDVWHDASLACVWGKWEDMAYSL